MMPRCALAGLLLMLAPAVLHAQGTSGPTVADSKVGYITNAIPGTYVLFDFDAGYNFQHPNRAEFFYAQSAPGGPGLPLPEKRIDYQQPALYGEYAFSPIFSVFLEQPYRMLNPEVNADHSGFSDLNGGFKYSFLRTDETVATFQFRTYAPTGDASEGLGTRHVTLEPSLLLYQAVSEQLALSGELAYWAPVGGTDFAGDIVRYGLGVQYLAYRNGRRSISPVLETVGWTVLGGKVSSVSPAGDSIVESAAGQTIVNIKFGVRAALSEHFDMYVGYGRPVTGDQWYQNVFRIQLRYLF